MSTIYPRIPRDIGAAQDVTWSSATYRDPGMTTMRAAIFGWINADFASVAGGETFDITQNGGAPETVTLAGTDITAALVRDAINAQCTGSPASLSAFGGLVVAADDEIEVSGYGTYPTDFVRVGLPEMVVTHSQSNPYVQLQGFLSTFMLSDPITVPPAATEAWIRMRFTGNDGDRKGHVAVIPCWSIDGGDADIGAVATNVGDYIQALIDYSVVTGTSFDADMVDMEAALNIVTGMLSDDVALGHVRLATVENRMTPLLGASIFPFSRIDRWQVPAGRRKLRLLLNPLARPSVSGPGYGRPPNVSASVAFAVR